MMNLGVSCKSLIKSAKSKYPIVVTKNMGPFLRCTKRNLQIFDMKSTHTFKTKSFDNHNTQGAKTKFHIFKSNKDKNFISTFLAKLSFRFLILISNEMEKDNSKMHTL
jgi:hypothetical protein